MDLSMDFIEGLPKSQGYNVILVVLDRLTKFAHFVVVKHRPQVLILANYLWTTLSSFMVFFIPLSLTELFKLYKVQLTMSANYHAHGQTERVHQCHEMYLRYAVQDAPKT